MKITKGSDNIFRDCGFPGAEAENLRMRAKLMMALTAHIQSHKLTQARAAKVMGVSQPRVSDLIRGKIGLFTVDALVNMATAGGLKVDLEIASPPVPKSKRVA